MDFEKINPPPLPAVASSPKSESKNVVKMPSAGGKCSRSLAVERATILMGCYRRDEANDPDIFIRGVTAILEGYQTNIVLSVTDPSRGLPSKLKWLPSLAEIKEACEKEAEGAKLAEPSGKFGNYDDGRRLPTWDELYGPAAMAELKALSDKREAMFRRLEESGRN